MQPWPVVFKLSGSPQIKRVNLTGSVGANVGDLNTSLSYITCVQVAFCTDMAKSEKHEVLKTRGSPVSCGSMPPAQQAAYVVNE